MTSYIALLRGINVSGKNKIPMAELRDLLSQSGFQHIQTYIQSGNIVFRAHKTDNQKLALQIQKVIKSHFGFDVPVLVIESNKFEQVFKKCPFPQERRVDSYFIFLFSKAEQDIVDNILELSQPKETFKITTNCTYLHSTSGYGRTKFNSNFFERQLNVTATARNYKTMVKLVSLSNQND